MANFIPVDEAVQHSKYSAGHIRHLIRNKLIEAKKVSVLWFVDLDSLQAYEQRMDEAGLTKFRHKSASEENGV
jgi:hypothetical protein